MNFFLSSIDLERNKFFQSSLCTLAEAATKGYLTLFGACKEQQISIEQMYPDIPRLESTSSLHRVPIHALSESLLPNEWKHLTPLYCYGDGNCLYRYASHINITMP